MSLNTGEKDAFYDFWKERADYVSIQAYANILEREDTAFFADQRPLAAAFRCPDPWQRMSLFVNGDLFPCCSDFGRLAPLGSARDTTVARVWSSESARRLRRLHRQGRWSEEPVCRRCALASTASEE
jgi:radical SAM protein with 4Fe4S-binding SPASM domain